MTQWQSRFTFGPAGELEVWEPLLPVGLWQHSVPTIGTTRKTATSVPGVTFGQRQQLLVLPVRYYETEWGPMRRLIEWGQTKAPFLWLPDIATPLLVPEVEVILSAPRVADAITPEPDGEYLRVSVLRLTLRQLGAGSES